MPVSSRFPCGDDQGDVVQARQVFTQPEKIQEFFERLKRDFLRDGESFLTVVEIYGADDWLRQTLGDQSPNRFEALFPADHTPASAT